MEEKKYPIQEENNADMVSEPIVSGASISHTKNIFQYKYSEGYNGFYTEDAKEFEKYKSSLIEEALESDSGSSWDEVKTQISERHPWLR